MGFEEIVSLLVFLIFILYRFFAGSKNFDKNKPGKGKRPEPQSEEKQSDFDDIFKEIFGEQETETTVDDRPKPASRPTSQQRRQQFEDDKSANKPEDFGSWAKEVKDAEEKLKAIEKDMADDFLKKQEKDVYKVDVYSTEISEEKREVVDLRQAIIHEAILNRPKF
ncbi:MAG: hypothetical protein EA412_02040 [Chitinophagaceae bacterium]|nr:MAG: hypothetical protein EA412_02040 [Chitinophagaceae bacterium]